MEINQLKAELEKGNVCGTYLVTGADALRREQAVRLLEEALCPPSMQEWCLVRVDATESSGAEVLDLVSTPPFLGERRLVVVKAADQLAGDEVLLDHVVHPPAFSTLVLVAESFDRRRKLFEAIQRHGRVLEYGAPSEERDLLQRIGEMARQLGVHLDRSALSALLARVGDDLLRAERELAKLALFAGGEKPVGEDAVQAVVAEAPPTLGQWAVFDYVDALSEGRGALALERLQKLLAAGESPLVVLAIIARQFRLLLAGLAWRGERPEALAQVLSMRSAYPVKKAMAQARGWSLPQIALALEECAHCDALLKRGADGQRTLELLTIKLVEMRRTKASR